MSETTTAAPERAAIIEAHLTACRVQVAEAIERRDALAGENERLRAALDAGASEVARLREELRIVSRYAARLHDAADDLIHLVTADERVRAAADRAVLDALYPGCVRHGDLSETAGVDPCAGCGEKGCEVRVWHAAVRGGRKGK
jgi:hypothetical protein